ncbi:unannotated protein [freshwater metagenome]|uniref:Unannotated protein n=1 Tax=freshwater metagenome TaxID=449393 RepID=A0A6J7KIZ0_9ZZZZ
MPKIPNPIVAIKTLTNPRKTAALASFVDHAAVEISITPAKT